MKMLENNKNLSNEISHNEYNNERFDILARDLKNMEE